jgi:uncharacterized protein YigE (DUF2233 family)
VEDGQPRHPVNTASGAGNFYLQPNGIFWTDADGRPHVETTAEYLANRRMPQNATQSGPMLVLHGQVNPGLPQSRALIRNGVGIGRDGRARFVISDDGVSFAELADFFRRGLDCTDALYLDGTVSSLWAPALKRQDGGRIGPILVVFDRN